MAYIYINLTSPDLPLIIISVFNLVGVAGKYRPGYGNRRDIFTANFSSVHAEMRSRRPSLAPTSHVKHAQNLG